MPQSVSIFYGSQTGCAESIAQRFYDEALERQYDAEFLPLNEFQNSKVVEIPGHHVIVVCSTTGNGEPPDNAGKFWRYVKRRTQPKDMLQNLNYTVLGLGDTNYDKFCYMGKSIDKRFAELGAQRFYDMCAADEALGLEDTVEPWADSLWAAFDKSCGAGDASTDTSSDGEAVFDGADGNVQGAEEEEAAKRPYLPASLISYETMFGPLSGPTEAPADIPKLPSPLFSVRFLDDGETAASSAATFSPKDSTEYSSTHPFLAAIVGAKYLTASHSERKVLGLEIDIRNSGIQYTPGDSIGIKCPNRAEDVDALLARLELRGEELFCLEAAPTTGRVVRRPAAKAGASDRFPSPCSVRDAFLRHADILSSPKKAALRALAAYCSDEEERARLLVLSSKSGAEKYKGFIGEQQVNFVELLHLFPSCNPPLDHLLSLLPQLMPRYYSIASSPLANPDQLSIALTIVENSVGPNGIRRPGLCSNWLDAIAQPLLSATKASADSPDVKIPIFLRTTRDFLLPASHQWPLLLIGPGTGVAPFMGFLQHRYYEVKNHLEQASDVCSGCWRGGMDLDMEEDEEFTKSPAIAESKGNYLFFGNRRKSEDWIFRKEMEEFVANGTIRQLFTAFSRDQEEKYYVQHELRANGTLVADLLLESGGYVYVCGDGVQMARDVHEALREVLQEHGNLSKEAAEEQLSVLASRQRYVRDIWG